MVWNRVAVVGEYVRCASVRARACVAEQLDARRRRTRKTTGSTQTQGRRPPFGDLCGAGTNATVAAADPVYDDDAMQALVRAHVACRLALDALPDLPSDIQDVVEEPLRTFCEIIGPELERVNPGLLDQGRDRPS
jgi:hypothetical protein